MENREGSASGEMEVEAHVAEGCGVLQPRDEWVMPEKGTVGVGVGGGSARSMACIAA